MKTTSALVRFASLLEQRLPLIDEVHRGMRESGFAAWQHFVDERVALVAESEREVELRNLLLSCREEFCNFARYTRNTGGDALDLPTLAERRRQARSAIPVGAIYLLRSDALMQADLSLAVRYANATRQTVSVALAAERSRYLEPLTRLIESRPPASVREHAVVALEQRFSDAGFASRAANNSAMCFEKSLAASASILACLEDVDSLGAAGWSGDVPLSFYVRPGGGLDEFYAKTCCKDLAGLQLRVGALVPGVDAYKRSGYLLPSSSHTVAGLGDVITLTVYECAPTSPTDQAVVVAQAILAVDCFLTILACVESALVAAITDLHRAA